MEHRDDRSVPFATLTEALHHWASTTPDARALTAGQSVLTYAELDRRVGQCMAWLSDVGRVQAGDRVVIVGSNTIAWVEHYLAVLGLGAIVAPANNRLNPTQFSDQVKLLDAVLVLADEEHTPIVAYVPGQKVRLLTTENVVDDPRRLPAPDPEAEALISFTSGTTGRPKGAVLSQRALAQASWPFAQVLGTTGTDSTLVLVPIFHNTGLIDQFGHMLLLGGRTDLLREFHRREAIETLRARQVTYLAAVPSIHRLLMLADGADDALSSITTLLYGGSPMPAAWIDELHERWPQMRLFHGYGMTEYGSAVSFLPSEYAASRGESIGFAVPGTRIRIVGDDGRDVIDCATGELWVQGPTMMSKYWRQPALTAEKISNGWLRTGDLAYVDSDGFYYIDGRVDDVINRGGEKVLPAHVEGLLSELDSVAQSCVFGVPDPVLQNRVWAVVEERPGHTFDETATRGLLATQLPDYAVPERIEVLSPLPFTASGKVDRRAIAKRYTEATKA
jgi:acyl-CoA synthetase (AMP-forming)/AMP-acid ligase II